MILSEYKRLTMILVAMIGLIAMFYHDTFMAIWSIWNRPHNPTYSHGPLLLLICIYILVRQWRLNKAKLTLKISYIGLLALLGSGLIWFVADVGSVQIIQIVSLISIFAFLFISFLGFEQAKPYLFPILLMIGAIPVWEGLLPYLELNTAVVAGWLTQLTIHPSIREGFIIHIPAGSFDVEEGCAGLAYFIVAIITSLLYSYSRRLTYRQTALSVLTAMIIAIVSNIIRVYIVVLSGQLTDMQSYFITHEHVSLGWAIFAIGITLYFWVTNRLFLPTNARQSIKHGNNSLKDSGDEVGYSDKDASKDDPNGNTFPKSHITESGAVFGLKKTNSAWVASIILIVVAITIGPLVNYKFQKSESSEIRYGISVPGSINGWQRTPYEGTYHPRLYRGNAINEYSYENKLNNTNIYLLINYFHHQRQGAEAVSDYNQFADGHIWVPVKSNIRNPNLKGFSNIVETRIRADDGEEKLLWSWYETNNTKTGRSWQAKLQNIIGIVRGRPSIKMVVLAIQMKSGVSDARSQLKQFINDIGSNIQIVQQKIKLNKD